MAASESNFTNLKDSGDTIANQWDDLAPAVKGLAALWRMKYSTGTEPADLLNGIYFSDGTMTYAWCIRAVGTSFVIEENTGLDQKHPGGTWANRGTWATGVGLYISAAQVVGGTLGAGLIPEAGVTQWIDEASILTTWAPYNITRTASMGVLPTGSWKDDSVITGVTFPDGGADGSKIYSVSFATTYSVTAASTINETCLYINTTGNLAGTTQPIAVSQFGIPGPSRITNTLSEYIVTPPNGHKIGLGHRSVAANTTALGAAPYITFMTIKRVG